MQYLIAGIVLLLLFKVKPAKNASQKLLASSPSFGSTLIGSNTSGTNSSLPPVITGGGGRGGESNPFGPGQHPSPFGSDPSLGGVRILDPFSGHASDENYRINFYDTGGLNSYVNDYFGSGLVTFGNSPHIEQVD